jgi:NADPH:quinone reductase-like Zn-dependent oxidoreductase
MGTPPISWMQKTPSVPECDVSGTIVEGDLAGTDLKVGEQVYGIKKAEDV